MLFGMLLFLIVMFGQLMVHTDNTKEEPKSSTSADKHVQLIIQNTDEYFWTIFKEGAKEAGEESNVYVEFVTAPQNDAKAIVEAVEKGIYAKVDGIALKPADTYQTQEIIEDAKKQGIPIAAYENYSYNITNAPLIGSNNYSIGAMAGNMAVEAASGKSNVAVIINDPGEEGDVLYKNLIIQGIIESFSKYSTMNLKSIYALKQDTFETEKVASAIIDEMDDVDLIICLDERSTPGVAQVLVDNNKVGDIRIVGYGIMPQTLDYIERGVIYGTVSPNAYEIGYYTVMQLVKQIEGEQISDYKNTELYTITSENVDEYSTLIEEK
jgi:ribose transport system substrate-binding protein